MYRHHGGARNKRLHHHRDLKSQTQKHHTDGEALSLYMHKSLDFLTVQLNWSIFTVLEEGIFQSLLVSYKIPWSAAALSLKHEDVFCYLPSPFFFLTSHVPKASWCEEHTSVCTAREKRTSLGSPSTGTSGDPGALWWREKNWIQQWK